MGDVVNIRDVSRDVFSATLGSVCCCYTGQPLDTIKVRMQTNPHLYTGVIPTFSKTVGEEGVAALWKGAVPTAVGMALENAVAFGVNEALKRAFPDDPAAKNADERPDLLKPFLMVRTVHELYEINVCIHTGSKPPIMTKDMFLQKRSNHQL
eukprot:scaffold114797_cov51-Attheya_sp.AAC.3